MKERPDPKKYTIREQLKFIYQRDLEKYIDHLETEVCRLKKNEKQFKDIITDYIQEVAILKNHLKNKEKLSNKVK